MGDGYVDDPSILDEDLLLRRIMPSWWGFDHNLGAIRPTSQAFDDHRSGTPMSVHLLAVLEQQGLSATAILEGHTGFALASITAGLVRQYGQGIRRMPLEADPAHAEVFGRKTQAVRRALAKHAVWIVQPSGVGGTT
jgi:hypothetical protein